MNETKHAIGIINIKFNNNQTSMLRTASFFGFNKVFYLGEKLPKDVSSCKSAHRHMNIRYYNEEWELIHSARSQGYKIVLIEMNEKSTSIKDFVFPEKCLFMTGHENTGFSDYLLEEADHVVHISGVPPIRCLNTAVAFGIAAHHLHEQELEINQ